MQNAKKVTVTFLGLLCYSTVAILSLQKGSDQRERLPPGGLRAVMMVLLSAVYVLVGACDNARLLN